MSPTFRALHNPNYRLYLAGSVVSNTGTWMMRVAQDWLVLQPLHGGSAAVGITTGLQFLPILLLTPYAGVVADRVPKRRLLQITQATMGAASLISGAVAVSGHSALWIVYLCALGLGVGAAFDAPARQSFVSEMVEVEDLTNAVGLNSASFNVARLMGPAAAGLLIAALGSGQRATGVVFLVNAASYAAVILQLRRMDPTLLHPADRRARGPHDLLEAVAYVRSQPRMLFVLIVIFFVGTFGMNFQLTSALMATQVYGKGAGEFGLLGSALAVGSLTGALMAARRTSIRLRLLVLGALGFGAAEVVAAFLPSYGLFALCCPLIGFSALTVANTANSTLQLSADPAYRGRVMALYMTVFQGGTPLGAPLIGWIGQAYGARWTLIVGGALVLVGAGIASTAYAAAAQRSRTPVAAF
ncbi:MFS transporter [Nocardioides baekrokdamisoli]|uniref:MFS transporter n=1 Tax=Nocardioides baekrokdamisoli TaxID=1804624 RepID=A0A3G9IFR1_9ACTN|nr:MFS transporter [Nocardioides baekrokdamisoli]BBH17890.1 MFS transporter [Nocardioides baekrokdamisoli]